MYGAGNNGDTNEKRGRIQTKKGTSSVCSPRQPTPHPSPFPPRTTTYTIQKTLPTTPRPTPSRRTRHSHTHIFSSTMSLPNNMHEAHGKERNPPFLLLLLFSQLGIWIFILPCLFKNLHLAMALRLGHAGGRAGLGLGLGLAAGYRRTELDWTGMGRMIDGGRDGLCYGFALGRGAADAFLGASRKGSGIWATHIGGRTHTHHHHAC